MARTAVSNNDETAGTTDESEVRSGEEVRKGPWTPEEDAILMEYVKKHGEGNWNSVQKNSGLLRCGKSCRLRWANHLRPNLKKGAFSPDEEQIILDLHSKLGNKWARMAAQLPGRTDNEIKNFWNTRMKRRQRAGLPLYPPEVHAEATAYHLQHRYLEQQQQPPHSSSSFSLLLSSCYPKKLNDPIPNQTHHSSNATPLQNNQPDHSANRYMINPIQHFKFCSENSTGSNGNFVFPPLSPLSPYGSSSSSLLNHSFGDHGGFISSGGGGGSPYEPSFPNLVQGSTPDISSNQTPTPASSYASGVDHGFMVNNNNNNNDYYEVAPLSPPRQRNSGLLDALVMEGQGLSYNDNKSKNKDEDSGLLGGNKQSCKRKNMEGETVPVVSAMKKKNSRNTTAATNEESQKDDDISSSQLPKGGKKDISEEVLEEMNAMVDDDLVSLLNQFPSEMPMPEWYRRGGENHVSLGLENQPKPAADPAADQEYAWTLGTCWNNMPRIC